MCKFHAFVHMYMKSHINYKLHLPCIQGATHLAERGQPQPYLLSTGTLSDHQQCMFLAVDGVIIGHDIKINQLPLVLLAAFFNICYVKGCSNLFSFIGVTFTL